ncbi:MAG TPA: CPBP family intramembrane glutamic endopeptidase [Terriglobales bacterium]|nr:CPBP family intramembrane glutamic endopeptidase [Terriglobales bacterium]
MPQEDVPDSVPRQPPRHPSQSIFGDENGVWPIWRVVVYGFAYYILRELLLTIARAAVYGRSDRVSPLWLLLLEEGLLLAAAIIPAVVLSKLEGRNFGVYGLPARGAFGKQFWAGAFWGLAAITVLLLTMRGTGLFEFGHIAVHGFHALKFAIFWGLFFLVVALYEDFLFRGYSLLTLSEAIGFWPTAVLLSLLFGFIHLGNHGETWVGALGAACIGLFFCLTLRRTGNLWFAVGMHAAWDWGESFLYAVPDSGTLVPGRLMRPSFHGNRWLTGGSVGPEASVLVFVLIAAMWIVFDRVYRRVRLSV